MAAVAVTATASAAPATWRVRGALLVMVAFFGGSLPAYKIALRSFGPATTNLGRFILAAGVLSIVGRRRISTAVHERRRLLLVGAFGIGLMALFLGAGVDKGSATIGSIVVGLEPLGVALAGVVLVGDAPTRKSVIALGVGFVGAVVASGVFSERGGPSPILPMVLLFGTVVTFSIYTAFVRRAGAGVHPLAVSALTQVGALAFVVPACLFDVWNGGMLRGTSVQTASVLAVIFLGLGSAIAYLLLCLVLASQPSSRVAVSMFLTPVLGVLASWIVVGERLHWRDASGGGLVLLALWISERKGRSQPVIAA